MNRRMRTRMYGGVRGRELVAPSYSLPLYNHVFNYVYNTSIGRLIHCND